MSYRSVHTRKRLIAWLFARSVMLAVFGFSLVRASQRGDIGQAVMSGLFSIACVLWIIQIFIDLSQQRYRAKHAAR
jgi:hypothetical protein